MDRLLSMEVFISAVRLGSFTAAATYHDITPAMVSKHIVGLEKRLGATLLARTTRSQKLTEIGLNYYERCKHILDCVVEAESGAEAMTTNPKGQLKVNASVWFGSLTLAPIVGDYLKQFPDVNIELSLTDRYIDIVEEGFDLAIRVGELKDSSLVARKLSMFEIAICASPDYLAQAGIPKTPDELVSHQCLGFTSWQYQGGWKSLKRESGSQIGKAPRFESNNGQALLAAAIKGTGIIMMPKELLRPEIESGKLVELLQDYAPPARPIHIVYPQARQMTPKLTSFVDFLIKSLRN